MGTWTAFTQEQKDIIVEQVKKYPTNLQYAFKEASRITGRLQISITNLWYSKLKFDPKIAAITCGSKHGFSQNQKNKFRDKDGNLPNQDLHNYIFIIKQIMDLPEDKRNAIITLLTN